VASRLPQSQIEGGSRAAALGAVVAAWRSSRRWWPHNSPQVVGQHGDVGRLDEEEAVVGQGGFGSRAAGAERRGSAGRLAEEEEAAGQGSSNGWVRRRRRWLGERQGGGVGKRQGGGGGSVCSKEVAAVRENRSVGTIKKLKKELGGFQTRPSTNIGEP
jgi:hypothetical protein